MKKMRFYKSMLLLLIIFAFTNHASADRYSQMLDEKLRELNRFRNGLLDGVKKLSFQTHDISNKIDRRNMRGLYNRLRRITRR